MPMNTMMTMPAMRTGRRPENAKAAMARSVLEGTWLMRINMGTMLMIINMGATKMMMALIAIWLM